MIFFTCVVNFVLFGVISVIIGGDALNGRVEDGHFYLGGGGEDVEVHCFVFVYSKLHAIITISLFPLAMLASLVYWASGGWNVPIRVITNAVRRPPDGLISLCFYRVELFYWSIADSIEGVFWILLDSWRKPDVEFFTRLSKRACIARLSEMLGSNFPVYSLDRPVSTYISGANFCLFKRPRFYARRTPFPALVGRFTSTRQGTYVRAWHRFSNGWMLFVPLFFGLLSIVLASAFIAGYLPLTTLEASGTLRSAVLLVGAVLLFLIALSFLWFWIGVAVSRTRNADLAEFLYESLEDRVE